MGWKPVLYNQWQTQAEADFWQPFGRARSNNTRIKMVRKQFEELHNHDLMTAHAFASRLAFDNKGVPLIRAYGFQFLTQMTQAAGDIDTAIDHALRCCEFQGQGNRRDVEILATKGAELLAGLVCGFGRSDRAAEAAEAIRQVPPTIVHNSDLERQLQTAACLSLTERKEEARQLANSALDKIVESSGRSRYGRLTYASKSRAINRALFALVRRSGRVRIAGLLGKGTLISPDQLHEKLAQNVYFSQATFELFSDRLIVDLSEFSLDFRWSADAEIIDQVRGRYDSFKEEDRQQIPIPPNQPEKALIILAIGDDDSLPEVINPMIDLATMLTESGESLFYEQAGPLAKHQ
ncbi:MAG: hypothetical protein AB8G95_14875 [Anaerolineae bacterium]